MNWDLFPTIFHQNITFTLIFSCIFFIFGLRVALHESQLKIISIVTLILGGVILFIHIAKMFLSTEIFQQKGV